MGAGLFEAGTRVSISAGPAPTHHEFESWMGDISYVVDISNPDTFVIMPAQDILLEARYRELPRFQLNVVDGSGSGSYFEGTSVSISALDKSSQNLLFSRWSGNGISFLGDVNASETSLTMPAQNLSLQAEYEAIVIPEQRPYSGATLRGSRQAGSRTF